MLLKLLGSQNTEFHSVLQIFYCCQPSCTLASPTCQLCVEAFVQRKFSKITHSRKAELASYAPVQVLGGMNGDAVYHTR